MMTMEDQKSSLASIESRLAVIVKKEKARRRYEKRYNFIGHKISRSRRTRPSDVWDANKRTFIAWYDEWTSR